MITVIKQLVWTAKLLIIELEVNDNHSQLFNIAGPAEEIAADNKHILATK